MVRDSNPNSMPAAPRAADGDWFTRQHTLILVLLGATALALYLCWQLVQPFLPALAWALALAVVARPLHSWVSARVANSNLAAGITVALVASAEGLSEKAGRVTAP